MSAPEHEPASLIGHTLDGRYRVEDLIGHGGMGEVYRGRHVMMDRAVALKVLRSDLSDDPTAARRFAREARSTFALDHPNCVRVTDFGATGSGILFIVMELLDGRTVGDELDCDGPIAPPRAVHIARQVCEALACAHDAGFVHRDLKPDNVMLLRRGGDPDFAKVLDFGLAKLFDNAPDPVRTALSISPLTQQGMVFGTPEYMSPEQATGQPLGPGTDLYSLGVVVYEMITGTLPFQGPGVMKILAAHVRETPVPPSAVRPDLGIPPGLDAAILSCMAKQREARPANARDVAETLAAVARGLSPRSRVPDAVAASSTVDLHQSHVRAASDDLGVAAAANVAGDTLPDGDPRGDSDSDGDAGGDEEATTARVPEVPPAHLADPAAPAADIPSSRAAHEQAPVRAGPTVLAGAVGRAKAPAPFTHDSAPPTPPVTGPAPIATPGAPAPPGYEYRPDLGHGGVGQPAHPAPSAQIPVVGSPVVGSGELAVGLAIPGLDAGAGAGRGSDRPTAAVSFHATRRRRWPIFAGLAVVTATGAVAAALLTGGLSGGDAPPPASAGSGANTPAVAGTGDTPGPDRTGGETPGPAADSGADPTPAHTSPDAGARDARPAGDPAETDATGRDPRTPRPAPASDARDRRERARLSPEDQKKVKNLIESAQDARAGKNWLKQMGAADQALRIDGRNRRAAMLMGEALIQQGDPNRGCRYLERARRLSEARRLWRKLGCDGRD